MKKVILPLIFWVIAISVDAQYTITLHCMDMTPHLGQMFEMRVVDKTTHEEVGRNMIAAIPSAEFSLSVPGAMSGDDYMIDFFADFNGNGLYDAPPADHAWRLEVNDLMGDTTLNFTHNTNFTDIMWPYLLTFKVAPLQPHIGEMFSVRVYNQSSGKEIYRTHVPSLPDDTTIYKIMNIVPGMSYNIDFFADHNANGIYDPPPTDHAWRIALNNVKGDTTILFTHNTDFTNIMWKYLLTLNFREFYPHIGNMFELWVKEQPSNNVVADSTIESIDTAFFTMSFPVLIADSSYHVDFYADLNGNGHYDPPPTDHAWRIMIDSVMGDTTIDFDHNTNFTDIMGQTTNINEIAQGSGYKIYPNPSNGEFRLSLQNKFTGKSDIFIFNTAGKLVSEYNFSSSDEIENHHFNLGKNASGIYLVQLRMPGKVESIPLIIKR